VYEWDQSLDEVNVYVPVGEGTPARSLAVRIEPNHLSVGMRGSTALIDGPLQSACKSEESFWTLNGGELHIQLQKAQRAKPWTGVIQGHESAAAADDDQRRIMLERFQEEHPGFDFSGAEFNGQVPDPHSFLGGAKTT